MRDHDQRGALLAVEVEHQLHHLLAGGEIQAAGWLVGQQHGRLHDEGACQRHALLLAARQHLGIVAQALRQADARQHVARRLAGVAPAGQLQRQHHVFKRGQVAEQLKALEHEADLACAQRGAGVFADGKQVFAVDAHRAARGRVEPGDDGQQRALARTRGADDGHGLARGQAEMDIAQNIQRAGGIGDRLENMLHRDDLGRERFRRCAGRRFCH